MPYPDYKEETDAALASCVQKCGSTSFRKALVMAVLREHRQHQGDFFLFMGELMGAWSKETHYDARNQHAVVMSKQIVEAVPASCVSYHG